MNNEMGADPKFQQHEFAKSDVVYVNHETTTTRKLLGNLICRIV